MNLFIGILIIFGLVFFLGRFMGILGEKLMILLLVLFVLILFAVTLGYAFV